MFYFNLFLAEAGKQLIASLRNRKKITLPK